MSELVVKVQVYYVLPVLDTYILIIIGLISVCKLLLYVALMLFITW